MVNVILKSFKSFCFVFHSCFIHSFNPSNPHRSCFNDTHYDKYLIQFIDSTLNMNLKIRIWIDATTHSTVYILYTFRSNE